MELQCSAKQSAGLRGRASLVHTAVEVIDGASARRAMLEGERDDSAVVLIGARQEAASFVALVKVARQCVWLHLLGVLNELQEAMQARRKEGCEAASEALGVSWARGHAWPCR